MRLSGELVRSCAFPNVSAYDARGVSFVLMFFIKTLIILIFSVFFGISLSPRNHHCSLLSDKFRRTTCPISELKLCFESTFSHHFCHIRACDKSVHFALLCGRNAERVSRRFTLYIRTLRTDKYIIRNTFPAYTMCGATYPASDTHSHGTQFNSANTLRSYENIFSKALKSSTPLSIMYMRIMFMLMHQECHKIYFACTMCWRLRLPDEFE